MKRSLIFLVLVAAACHKHETAVPEVIGTPPQMPQMQMASSMQPIPDRNAPVLTAPQLHNPAAANIYAEAAQITDRLSKMYCYCQCHESEGHVSLLTCFQTNHAESAASVCAKRRRRIRTGKTASRYTRRS